MAQLRRMVRSTVLLHLYAAVGAEATEAGTVLDE